MSDKQQNRKHQASKIFQCIYNLNAEAKKWRIG